MSFLFKNVAGQKLRVFAFNTITNAPVLDDQANITCKVAKDWGAATALADTNPVQTEGGYYLFDLAQAETDADDLAFYPSSATENVQVIPVAPIRTLPSGYKFDLQDAPNAPAVAAIQNGLATPANVWANVSRTLTAGTKDTEIDGIKTKTDQLDFTGTDGALVAEATNITGGDATLENQLIIINAIAALGGSDGPDLCTQIITENGQPVADAWVWVTTDAAGNNIVSFQRTDEFGHAPFLLTAGETYYLFMRKVGMQQKIAEPFVAVAD